MTIFLWCFAGYLALGIGFTWMTSGMPIEDGWIMTTLLWPLYLWAIVR